MQNIVANKTAVTASTFASKFRSKREIYVFLTVDVKAYYAPVPTLPFTSSRTWSWGSASSK